jgi:demethylmenaquinone methyltransferase/2-methoxy-6-polyprenyl-1,4-benzoquinol methylase
MLEVARSKVASRALTERIELLGGTAEALPFDDETFWGATIAFGIRNVPDRAACMREMARVVAPGGRLVVLELSDPSSGLAARAARFHIHTVVPALGALFSGAREYRYLERSIAALPPPSAFADMAVESGLELVELSTLTFGVAFLLVARKPVRSHREDR